MISDSLKSLKNLVDRIHPLSDEDWNLFSSGWEPIEIKRKEILTQAGETEKYLYFTIEGVQRIFYFDEQQREATLLFIYSPSFGGVLDSLLLQQPSRYTFEALTPSSFIRIPVKELLKRMESRPPIASLIQKGTTQALSGLLERMAQLQCFSSEEKFKSLLQ